MNPYSITQPRHICDLDVTRKGTPELGSDLYLSRMIYVAVVSISNLFKKRG